MFSLQVRLGTFSNEMDAARLYDRSLIKWKGREGAQQDGRLNFPISDYDEDDAIEAGILEEGAAAGTRRSGSRRNPPGSPFVVEQPIQVDAFRRTPVTTTCVLSQDPRHFLARRTAHHVQQHPMRVS